MSPIEKEVNMLNLTQIKSKCSTRLAGLHPVVLSAATLLIERCYSSGVPILITQGLRTIAEQAALYAQGRTKPGVIVTNAKEGYSYHNYGLAIDFALLLPSGTAVSWDKCRDGDGDMTADWQEVVQQAKALGFEWGGDWSSFKDYPHLQMTFGLTLAELRGGTKPSEGAINAAYATIKARDAQSVEKVVTAVIQVNGVKVADGILENGITYVPVRALAKALGAKISYDSTTQTVKITSRYEEK
ncbi:M15 family metallopeptidase [Paenibacillus wynnii]|uniref:M15 family metallopeptidase n=1 Tax=Paenibacillus wynnii TaxID=268407 RepID=UPI00278CB12B|nr:M15 family metallopeptidase [Paenibacillus wynnii]MDQ0195814.1 peptidoglycan L-alanyl-D-glutamate endopeptidase CwlK [Paenibacillus wynnii]